MTIYLHTYVENITLNFKLPEQHVIFGRRNQNRKLIDQLFTDFYRHWSVYSLNILKNALILTKIYPFKKLIHVSVSSGVRSFSALVHSPLDSLCHPKTQICPLQNV